jgi:nucleotide-binding universal stress UspA family protein
MYQKILVTTDGSSLSKKAVRSATDLARSLAAQLIVLHVVPRYPLSYFEGGLTISVQEIARTEKQWAETGQAVVDAAVLQAKGAKVAVKGIVAQSDRVSETILATVRKHKCDLVVMASHGRKGLKRVLLGSETQQVLTHGSVPVLVLR